ncbi:hypothetical protein [Micromonospora yangpuensis]|uniref:Uncharacterized protein n=1 Tax=Micromonospora yangpuensis TaxID=683228 RepID=A0A1C6U475_9ACTN|nr:hypothetical protein [Micromonospora yangpuensis]GGL93279.1 hypothetical protein GCM10012279_08740 [Micromonospora yangpuensis]SCL48669.1 hypothetical protein GA0070617_0943 [Micromonospora yangpuensis]
MVPTSSTGAAAAPVASNSEQIRQYASVAEATLALGCKTYSGTVAQGGGGVSIDRSGR